MGMRLIDDKQVAACLDMADAIAALRVAFKQFGLGAGAVLPRQRASAGGVTISAMGAALPESGVVGSKVYSTVHGRFQFVIVLFDAHTGTPLACMEANELTRLRTAATTALAVEALTLAPVAQMALFGAGTQAYAHAEALWRHRRPGRIAVCARSGGEAFAARLSSDLGIEAYATDAATAIAGSQLIVTCTRASEPLFDGALVEPGTLVAAVGSSKPQARELDDTLLGRAAALVTEWTPANMAEAGEWVGAAPGVIASERVHELGVVLAGTSTYRPAAGDIVVYKSVGIGLEDVALAKRVWDRLIAN